MHWPAAVFNLFLCTKPSNNCKHYQQEEKRRKISRVVSLWNIKELNLKEWSLIIASKFSKCLYPSLSVPGFFCVSCLMIFRIYSNIFCFSPCICCEVPVSLKESVRTLHRAVLQQTRQQSVGHSQVPHLQTCILELFLFNTINLIQIPSAK